MKTYYTIPLARSKSGFGANTVLSKAELRRELEMLKNSLQVQEIDLDISNPVAEFETIITTDQTLDPVEPIQSEPLLEPNHNREQSASVRLLLSPPPRGDIYSMPASLAGIGNGSVIGSLATSTSPQRLNHLEFTVEQIDGCFDL